MSGLDIRYLCNEIADFSILDEISKIVCNERLRLRPIKNNGKITAISVPLTYNTLDKYSSWLFRLDLVHYDGQKNEMKKTR